MKKLFALMLSAAMLLGLFTGCTQTQTVDHSAELAQLQQEISDLQGQVQALQERVTRLETGAVADWSLTGTPLTQGSGATVTLSVTPTAYQEGMLAMFRVLLEGQTVAELYCDWNGSAFTSTVDLDAADGYSYYVLLTDPSGAQEHLELNSPEKPVDPLLVYLYSSLTAACTLNIYEWEIGSESLSILSGSAQLQLPQMTATGEAAACIQLELVLQLDGQELARQPLDLPQAGETNPTVGISNVVFDCPELDEGSQLDLWLEAVLSDGQTLSHFGSSWFCADGELIQAVG